MTPRERITAMLARVSADSERNKDKAGSQLVKTLAEILPRMSDRACAKTVADWDDESAAS